MQIALLLYEGLTTLDIIGPYETLCRLPAAEVCFVAKQPGEIRVDTGVLGLVADHSLADVTAPDVIVVPGGGRGTIAASQDPEILNWLEAAHTKSRFTASVCTGSLILGAAGLLAGRPATTHWAAKAALEQFGATYTESRVVWSDKIVTAAGVSSGIDMGLALAAKLTDEDTARAMQLAIEYDPEPPFDSGSPSKAGERITRMALVELAKDM